MSAAKINEWIDDIAAIDMFVHNIQHDGTIIRIGYKDHDECKSAECERKSFYGARDVAIATPVLTYYGYTFDADGVQIWMRRDPQEPVQCGYKWLDISPSNSASIL